MLPMKLDLTEELAATLRQLRLDHPVNGEVLTAENLSKAIGNNRAWMSQIESRRLKKIIGNRIGRPTPNTIPRRIDSVEDSFALPKDCRKINEPLFIQASGSRQSCLRMDQIANCV